jgi:RNA polymerase sigma-70 factor (ECF subfamily)
METYAIEQATLRARLLGATAGFPADEIEDARQELLLDFLRRSPRFDGERGDWGGFVRGVMRHQTTVLVTRRCRRARHEFLPGDQAALDDDQPGDFLENMAVDRSADGIDLSIDVRRVLRQLPDHLRTLAHLLPQMSIMEISVTTGKSRSRVYQMVRQIREAFASAGLRPGSVRNVTAIHEEAPQ